MALARLFERRFITSDSLYPTSGAPTSGRTSAGVVISQENALKVNAVYSAVRLYVDTVSMLPIDSYIRRGGERQPLARPVWIDDPDPDGLTRQQFFAQWIVSKLISHAACVRKLRDESEAVVALAVLDPRRVTRYRDQRTSRIVYAVDGNRSKPIAAEDMIYDSELLMPGALMGTSRVDQMRETLGLAQALETFAAMFFGNGTTLSGVVEAPGAMTAQQVRELQDGWEADHKGLRRAHRPGVLGGGAVWKKTGVDPENAQMIESREFALEEVCRAFRIPPAMLGSQKPGSKAYASREQDAIEFTTFSLMPYVTAIEAHLSRLIVGPGFVKFNVDALLRASLTDRFAAYSQGITGGFTTLNRINDLEDWPRVEGGDVYRVPLTNINLDAANLVEMQKRVEMAAALVAQGYDHAAACAAVGLPPIKAAPVTPSQGSAP